MGDTLDDLLTKTRERLGRQDIFNAPPGTITDDHIAQLRKKLLGEQEPEKQSLLPAKLRPEKKATFPEFVGALATEAGTGALKGLLAPVSSFIKLEAPFTPNDIERTRTIRSYLRRDDVQGVLGDAEPLVEGLAAVGPSKVGEVLGTITSFIPVMRATKAGIAGVQAADRFLFPHVTRSGSKLAQLAAENVGSTTLFEAAMELDEGEDRLSRIVFDSTVGASIEGAGAIGTLLRQGVRNELGRTAYRNLTRAVPENIVTKVRAGVATPEEAEAVLNVAKKHSDVATTATGSPTTVVAQARKIQEAVWDKILPPPGGYVVDPQMALDLQVPGKRPGVYYKIKVGDQVIDDHIPTGKTQEEAARFGNKLVAIRDRVNQLVSEGQDVRILEVRGGDTRALNRFKNYFLGKTSSRRVTGDTRVPKVPNSVGPESAAVRGTPEPGTRVRAKTETGFEEVEVVSNPNPINQADEVAGTRSKELRVAGQPAQTLVVETTGGTVTPPSKGKQSAATVWVKGRDGKVRPKDIREITVAVPIGNRLQLKNHESGEASRFLVHLGEKRTEFESIAAPLGGDANFFRSEFFDEIDSSSDYHESVRGAFRDGQITLSAPMVYDERIPTAVGPALRESIPEEGANVSMHYRERRPGPHFIGSPSPGDVEHTLLGRVAPTYEGRYVPGVGMVDNRYKPLRDYLPPLTRGTVPAGYDPISDAYPPTQLRRQRVVGEREAFTGEDVEPELAELVGAADEPEYAPAHLRGLASRGLSPEDVGVGLDEPGLVPISTYLNKDTGPNNPAFVSLQRAAKVLRDQGVDGSTSVSLHASNTRYLTYGSEASWTLDEIIDTQLPFPVWSHMQQNADARGLKVRPTGKGAVVSTMDGTEYRFDTQMEAYEAIGRIPVNKVGPKLEAEIEKALGFGSERTFDADVDVDSFRPRRIQTLAVQELIQGGRPAVTVQTRNVAAVRGAMAVVERQAGLKPSTYKVQIVGQGAGPRKQVVIYDPTKVKQAVVPVAPFLEAHLGVKDPVGKAPELLVQELARLPQGVGIVSGRDVHSAAMYTWLRKKGMKEEWKAGSLTADALGPYRTYPQAQGFIGALQGQPSAVRPQIMAMATNLPDNNGHDLSDFLELPEGMGAAFTPPPKPTVPELTDEAMDEFAKFVAAQRMGKSVIDDQGGGLGQQLYSWIAVPMRHWQQRQTQTGLPFFDWWESISLARKNVEVTMNDLLAQNRQLSKQFSRDVRIQGQQLFEAKMQKTGYEAMLENADENVKAYAGSHEQMLRTYFKDHIGVTDEQFEFFWGDEVSSIRKSDGDYAAYLNRNPIPGPSRTIINQLRTGEVMFDQREWDGGIIAKRVARAFAHEKHLVPAHKEVTATFTAYVNAGRVPQPDYANFVRYLHEALHRPDDLQLALSYGVKKTVDAIVKKFPGSKRYLSEAESVNVVDAFSAANTFSNMGFQPGMVMRNFIGGAQMIYMRAPAKHATEGLAWAAGAIKDPAKRAWLEHRGVIMRDPVSQSVAQIGEAVRQMEGGRVLGAAGTGFSKALEKGMGWYKKADDMTRVWAYKTQYDLSKELGGQVAEGKITIDGFIDKGNIDLLGPIVERNTRRYLEAGQYEEVAHYTATYFKDQTQFQYERGNVPRILQSTLGRLFGQYGTWPLSYIDTIKNLVSGPGSRKNRYTALTKWAAIHGATYTAMASAFGVDFTRWSFLAPMGFKGGPFLELADQATSVMKSSVAGDEDVVSRLQAARLKDNAIKQLTPLPWGAVRTGQRTYEDAVNMDWPSMMRSFLGLPGTQQ